MAPWISPNLTGARFVLDASELVAFPIGSGILGDERSFRSLFGNSPDGCADTWKLSCPHLKDGTKPVHLLWALLVIRVHATEDVLCGMAGVTRKTFSKSTWQTIHSMRRACPKIVSNLLIMPQCRRFFSFCSHSLVIQINLNNRLIRGVCMSSDNRTCKVTVDGTDCPVHEVDRFPINRRWFSHKFQSAGVRHEAGVSNQTGDI